MEMVYKAFLILDLITLFSTFMIIPVLISYFTERMLMHFVLVAAALLAFTDAKKVSRWCCNFTSKFSSLTKDRLEI